MPAQFQPTHATAIILYGHEACANFTTLLEYWNGVLEKKAWNRYLFVLLDTQRFDPLQIPAEIRSSCWSIDPESLQNGGRPEEIINEIRKRIEKCNVLLQCVCSLQEDTSANPDALISFLRNIQSDFMQGSVTTILYIVLHDQEPLRARQKVFAERLHENRKYLPYIYLLGSFAEDDSMVSPQAMWRALNGELLAHSATERVLPINGLFSLGLSTLNANNEELKTIRYNIISDWIVSQVSEPISPQDAWRMFTQSKTACPNLTVPDVSAMIKRFLEQIARRYTELPSMTERINNRILSSLYNRQQKEADTAIRRFYQINIGNKMDLRAATQKYMHDFVDLFIRDLQNTYNAQAFPLSFLECVTDSLKELASNPAQPKSPPWPPCRAFTTLGKKQYIDQQCTQTESMYEQIAIAEHVCVFAVAWIQELNRVREFIQTAAGLPDVLQENHFTAYEIECLKDKYKNYTEAVRNSIAQLHGRTIFGDLHLEYFESNGVPKTTALQDVRSTIDQALQRNLPRECNGSFCSIVSWECASQQGLNTFFGEYLGGSKRMLYEPMDMQGSRNALYYSDANLASHKWFGEIAQEIVIAHNDNVERVDLFTLQKDLRWYIDNNRNFRGMDAASAGGIFAQRLGDYQTEPVLLKADAGINAPIVETAAANDTDPNAHNLKLTITKNFYVLTWDWQQGIDVAIVSIYQNEYEAANFITPIDRYLTPKDDMLCGVDISAGLPYGRIHVVIHSQKGFYARSDMAGRKNEVQFEFKPGKNGYTLAVRGTANDVSGLVLNVQRNGRPNRVLRYPLSVSGDGFEHIYKNIMEINPEKCSLLPPPEEGYPTVYATQIHG